VAEQLLHGADVMAALQQMRRERMAQVDDNGAALIYLAQRARMHTIKR
jgi:hypothetical protein